MAMKMVVHKICVYHEMYESHVVVKVRVALPLKSRNRVIGL